MNARFLAVKTLTPLLSHSGSLKNSLFKHISACPDNQRALMQELCYGTMRHYPRLICILSKLVKKPLKKKDNDIVALLLIGIHQLTNMNIPEHAALSETVDVAKTLKKPWATSLVNAALRNYLRTKPELFEALSSDISFKFNHPDWFIEKLKHNWPEQWQTILSANDQHPPLTIRVDTQCVSRETFKSQLENSGLNSTFTPYSPYGLTFSKPTDVTQIEGFNEGLFSVQDEAAQLAAKLTNPQGGENILDACSAPGGKLLHLLELSKGKKTRIQGLELEPSRAKRIEENFNRLNLHCELHVADATKDEWWDGVLFDKILLDAPCSATGVIRRNPDIKLLRQPEDIHSVAKLQKKILTNLWSMLKPKGEMIYATCSIFPQENERIIASFLKGNTTAKHVIIDAHWGVEREFGRQLFPSTGGHDGFYYAKLIKQ
jgi:16S rRNA (cytosine967-C5)-methyltransferase